MGFFVCTQNNGVVVVVDDVTSGRSSRPTEAAGGEITRDDRTDETSLGAVSVMAPVMQWGISCLVGLVRKQVSLLRYRGNTAMFHSHTYRA